MAESPSLYEEFSYTGFWWLPENIHERWPSTVTYTPKGINLELTSDPNQNHELPSIYTNAQTLHGLISDVPSEVTLQGCLSAGLNSRFYSGVKKRNYRAIRLLKGVWLSPSEDITCKSLEVVFSSLDGWLQTTDPKKPINPFTVKDDNDHLTAFYRTKTPTKISVPDSGINLIFSTELSEKSESHLFEWKQSGSLYIVSDMPMPLRWYLDQMNRTKDLLAFLTGLPVEIKSIVVSLETTEVQPYVSIYFPVQPPIVDSDSAMNMLFPLDQLGDLASTVFQTWFKKQQKFRTVIELCLAILYNHVRLNRFEFLALMQALESYHRVKHGDDNMSLKRRLRCLHGSLPPQHRYVVYNDDYLKALVNTRICFTHDIDKKCQRALQGPDLYDAITRLITFIATLLYREMGLRDEKIVEAIHRTDFYGLWSRPRLHR